MPPSTAPDPGDPIRRAPRAHSAGVLLILLLALGLRLWPIEHGLPENYLPDTHVVRSALGMGNEGNPVPPVRRYSTYPNLLPYLLLPVYGAQYAIGKVRGEWGSAGQFGRYLYEHPEDPHLLARILVACLGALAVWVVYRAGRVMGLGAGALAAAWLVATGLLHVHFSVQERPWAPLVTFMALAAWPAAHHMSSGSRRSLLTSGICAGLAFATHQAGLAALGIPGLAWLLGPLAWRGAGLRQRAQEGVVCVLAFGLVALFLGHPYYLVHGLPDRAAVAAGDAMGDSAISIGGQAFVFEVRWESLARLARAFADYDPVLVLLALCGLVPVMRLRGARPAVLFALAWAAIFMTNQNDHVRYLLPLSVLLAWPAALAVELGWRRRGLRPVLLVLLALPLVQALRLGWVLRQDDTRAVAREQLEALAASGVMQNARVAIDFHGPLLEADAWSLEALSRLGTRGLYSREQHRYDRMLSGALARADGWSVIRLEDLAGADARTGATWLKESGGESVGDDLNTLLTRLGITHVLLVDRTPDDGRPPILADPAPPTGGSKLTPLRIGDAPLFSVHPAGDGRLLDGHLPTEIDFPLTELWHAERPGPKIELFTFDS